MDRKAAKELAHIQGWLDRAGEIVERGKERYLADDLLTLRFAILQGVGAGFMPDYMCQDDLRAGRLVEALPGWHPPSGIVHAMYPPRRALVPAVRLLLDFFAEHLQRCDEELNSRSNVPVAPA